MIDKKNLETIKKDMARFDELREDIIKLSRDILRNSKSSISNVHREDFKNAETLLKSAEEVIDKCKKLIQKEPKLSGVGAYSDALQEYVEAKTYYSFMQKGKIPSDAELKVPPEEYLLGLCDLTGELERKAVNSAIQGNYKLIAKIKLLVEDLHSFFMSIDLRNGDLRKKADSIKWNLKKIEEVLYDIKMKK